jgi:hypothetical protein
MLNQKKIILGIGKTSKNFFSESSFYLHSINNNKYFSTGNNTSKAINHNKNTHEEINVIKWFDDFWVYMEITFNKADNKTINIFFTLSVFEGDSHENFKTQLFRAEWDSYNNNLSHPQPHWHFYPNEKIDYAVKKFEDIIDNEESEFVESTKSKKGKGININKMHFAMSGQWDKDNGHIHCITDENELLNWYQGLMSHIKTQLEYVK